MITLKQTDFIKKDELLAFLNDTRYYDSNKTLIDDYNKCQELLNDSAFDPLGIDISLDQLRNKWGSKQHGTIENSTVSQVKAFQNQLHILCIHWSNYCKDRNYMCCEYSRYFSLDRNAVLTKAITRKLQSFNIPHKDKSFFNRSLFESQKALAEKKVYNVPNSRYKLCNRYYTDKPSNGIYMVYKNNDSICKWVIYFNDYYIKLIDVTCKRVVASAKILDFTKGTIEEVNNWHNEYTEYVLRALNASAMTPEQVEARTSEIENLHRKNTGNTKNITRTYNTKKSASDEIESILLSINFFASNGLFKDALKTRLDTLDEQTKQKALGILLKHKQEYMARPFMFLYNHLEFRGKAIVRQLNILYNTNVNLFPKDDIVNAYIKRVKENLAKKEENQDKLEQDIKDQAKKDKDALNNKLNNIQKQKEAKAEQDKKDKDAQDALNAELQRQEEEDNRRKQTASSAKNDRERYENNRNFIVSFDKKLLNQYVMESKAGTMVDTFHNIINRDISGIQTELLNSLATLELNKLVKLNCMAYRVNVLEAFNSMNYKAVHDPEFRRELRKLNTYAQEFDVDGFENLARRLYGRSFIVLVDRHYIDRLPESGRRFYRRCLDDYGYKLPRDREYRQPNQRGLLKNSRGEVIDGGDNRVNQTQVTLHINDSDFVKLCKRFGLEKMPNQSELNDIVENVLHQKFESGEQFTLRDGAVAKMMFSRNADLQRNIKGYKSCYVPCEYNAYLKKILEHNYNNNEDREQSSFNDRNKPKIKNTKSFVLGTILYEYLGY